MLVRGSGPTELVLCHYGTSKYPPQHLKSGHVITGMDGQEWAFTGDAKDGRTATFTRHNHRSASHRALLPPGRSKPASPELARLASPAKEPSVHMPNGQRIIYSSKQWVEVFRNGNQKKYIPHHQDADGHGQWIAEADGEKCGAWFRAAGVVTVSFSQSPPGLAAVHSPCLLIQVNYFLCVKRKLMCEKREQLGSTSYPPTLGSSFVSPGSS